MDLQKVLEFRNSRNRFCHRLGIVITELSPGYAKVVKTVEEEDLNPGNIAHGGLYFTMADNAAGSAMAAYGTRAVTLTAVARESKHGGTICVYEVRITDQNDNLTGTGTFTFYDLKQPLDID